MKRLFYGFLAVFLVILPLSGIFAQQNVSTPQKYALVIGNNNYKNGITPLLTPVNDANDVAASLKTLGYETVLKTNTTITEFDEAVNLFLIKLGANKESEGFFWFAGHGINIENKHYLLAVDVVDPRSDDSIIRGSYSVDKLLEKFDRINNKANLLVIDACRNDFVPGSRNVSGRGLAVVASDSVVGNVIAYSTRAGQTADDGKPGDRNSPFATAFLGNIKTAESFDNLFIQIVNDTRAHTNNRQTPYKIGFFTIKNYTIAPVSNSVQTVQPASHPSVTVGNLTVTSDIAGVVMIDGEATGTRIKAGGTVTIANISTGATEVAVRGDDGKIVKAPQMVMVVQGQAVAATIKAPAQPQPTTPAPTPAPVQQPAALPQRPVPANMVRIQGGTFTMGSPANEPSRGSDETHHQVTVSSFYMGKYEVTQKEYQEVMGTNPSIFKGDNLPVENIRWYEAIEYCNKRSQKEGLTPAYTIDKNPSDSNNNSKNDTMRWLVTRVPNADGYRLPTEAEWEYACRAGTTTPFNTGNNIITRNANYDGNNPYNNNAKGEYRQKTTPVGSFAPNAWGLYDMHGNVWEWCWDWYGAYSSGAQTDPVGASSGAGRVYRGGSWGSYAELARSAYRSGNAPSYRYDSLGFRLVRP
jgi:formylglycine-generating enzyme required for sulfatase activity